MQRRWIIDTDAAARLVPGELPAERDYSAVAHFFRMFYVSSFVLHLWAGADSKFATHSFFAIDAEQFPPQARYQLIAFLWG